MRARVRYVRQQTGVCALLARLCSSTGVRRGTRTFPGARASCCCSRARLFFRSVLTLILTRTFQTPWNARTRTSSAVTADAYLIYGIATATEIARTGLTRTPLSAVSCNFFYNACNVYKYCDVRLLNLLRRIWAEKKMRLGF